jgi:ribosomal protein S18 acetylase RimI-like enzyme
MTWEVHDAVPLEAGGVVDDGIGRFNELQQLWVADRYRGEGIGSKLLEMFQNHAAKHGCRTFYLETFSFQAPVFYQQAGYGILAEIRGYPDGIVKYIMGRSGVPPP